MSMTLDRLRAYWTRLCEMQEVAESHIHGDFESCDVCRENGLYDEADRRYEAAAIEYVDQLMSKPESLSSQIEKAG